MASLRTRSLPRLARAAVLALGLLALDVLAPAAFDVGRRAAAAEREPTRGLRYPTLTPDGRHLVFAWRGDVWRAPVSGEGAAVRLTAHEAQDTKPRVSPDGRSVAFSSRRTGDYEVYVVSIDGGEPRRVTFHSATDIVTDWSPDGRRLLFQSSRDASPGGLDLFEVDAAGGTARRVTRDGGRDGAYTPDGKTVVYVRGFNTVAQDGYEGSAAFHLHAQDLAGGIPRRLTRTREGEASPGVSADGTTVYVVVESGGAFQVAAVPLAGGEPRRLTTWPAGDVRRASLAADRKTLVFERDAKPYLADLSAADPRLVPIDVHVASDARDDGIDLRTLSHGAEHPALSPDGRRIAVAAYGDLWVLDAAGGEAQRLTSGPARDDWPRWSPDGKRLVYFSNARGNDDVFVVDVATRRTTAIVTSPQDDAFPSFSPDGQRILFTSDRAGNKDLWIHDLATGKETQLTKHPKDDDDATFSPDGRYVAFDSGRDGAQAIYVMPADGDESQARRVTSGTAFCQVPAYSPDGAFLAYEELDVSSGASGGVFVVRATGGPAVQVSRDGSVACYSPSGEWVYFGAERDGVKDVFRVRAPTSVEGGERVPFLARIRVDRRAAFGDLFDEAWALLRQGFYDAKMHGVDWEALKAKYRPLAVDAEIREEFRNVVGQMLAELKASHLGIYGGDDDDGGETGPPTGYLGLEFESDVVGGGGRRIASVASGGPADTAGLRAGDVVVSIGGDALATDGDVERLLLGRAGTTLELALAAADGVPARSVAVKTTGLSALAQARYAQRVERARSTVESATGGTAGYVHLDAMNPQNLDRFRQALVAFDADPRVTGLVLDVRDNGGGNIHDALIAALVARPYAAIEPRGRPRQVQPTVRWGKPVVLLANERSFSDAEVFAFAFKTLRLGTLVGVPTAGGVIGTTDVTLSDGSKLRVPSVGYYGLDGTNLEGLGVAPDVLVEETPEDRAEGRDPQLRAAIAALEADVKARAAAPAR